MPNLPSLNLKKLIQALLSTLFISDQKFNQIHNYSILNTLVISMKAKLDNIFLSRFAIKKEEKDALDSSQLHGA